MKIEKILIILALSACAIPLLPWLWTFWAPGFSLEPDDWADFGTFIGGVLSPLLAFASFVGLLLAFNAQRVEAARLKAESDDLNYFNHAVKSLERAYETLIKGAPDGELVRDRLTWLTCARQLLSAKDVSGKISSNSAGLNTLYEGEEEHWRHQFHDLLYVSNSSNVLKSASYFGNSENVNGIEIEERSIRVIYEFADWPEGKKDPMESVDYYTAADVKAMGWRMKGVREYVATMTRFQGIL